MAGLRAATQIALAILELVLVMELGAALHMGVLAKPAADTALPHADSTTQVDTSNDKTNQLRTELPNRQCC